MNKGWLGRLQQGRKSWHRSTFKGKNDGTIWICLFYSLTDFMAKLHCVFVLFLSNYLVDWAIGLQSLYVSHYHCSPHFRPSRMWFENIPEGAEISGRLQSATSFLPSWHIKLRMRCVLGPVYTRRNSEPWQARQSISGVARVVVKCKQSIKKNSCSM